VSIATEDIRIVHFCIGSCRKSGLKMVSAFIALSTVTEYFQPPPPSNTPKRHAVHNDPRLFWTADTSQQQMDQRDIATAIPDKLRQGQTAYMVEAEAQSINQTIGFYGGSDGR
jgi:hypothetical protein